MEYFAGIFDADGYITLSPRGNFIIALEKHNEAIVQLLQETFGGHIYKRKREKRKTTLAWMLTSDRDIILSFIGKIKHLTHIKTAQLSRLEEYLNLSRHMRSSNRAKYVADIARFKHPITYTREQIKVPTTITPEDNFFKWFAGFMDGDGNFSVFEYQNYSRRSFDSGIKAFNTFGEPIIYIKERIEGCISQYKGNKYPVWNWTCGQNASAFVCDSLYPNLINRKEQCRLVSEFLKIHATKIRGIDHSDEVVAVIRDIIKQIKYHNSL